MGIFSKARVKALGGGRVRVAGEVTLAELYEAVPTRELLVEPLSRSQSLAEFLAEGGLGFGSLGNGTFAGQILRVEGRYSDGEEGIEFRYGLGAAPLYNVGYPLQRIMEGGGAAMIEGCFEAPSELVLATRERGPVAVEHSAADSPDLPGPDGSENVMFANVAAAAAMGLPGAGIVRAHRDGRGPGSDGWSRRFVMGAVPTGQEKLLVLTQPSGAKALHEAHRSKGAGGLFLALAVHLGVLVAASAPADAAAELARKAAELPLTWRLGAPVA
jgi:hypothetical protein